MAALIICGALFAVLAVVGVACDAMADRFPDPPYPTEGNHDHA